MAETYTLRLLVDDSAVRRLESRMNRIMSMRDPSGGGGGSQKKGLGGFIEGMMGMKTEQKQSRFGMFKAVGKLALISGGVAAILLIAKKLLEGIVESSPMLQGMLKIMNTASMFMLRPIGDFLGYFLRPIVIFFLRNIAVPFYREWAPKAREWGTLLGTFIAHVMGFIGGDPIHEIVKKIREAFGLQTPDLAPEKDKTYEEYAGINWWDDIVKSWQELISSDKMLPPAYGDTGGPEIEDNWWAGFVDKFAQSWAAMTEWLETNVWGPLQYVWTTIVNWFVENIWAPLENVVGEILDEFVGWFQVDIGEGLKEILSPIWDQMIKFWEGLKKGYDKVILPAWVGFAMLWSDVGKQLKSTIGKAWERFYAWWSDIGLKVPSLAKIWNSLVGTFQDILNGFVKVYNDIRQKVKDWLGFWIGPEAVPFDFSDAKADVRETSLSVTINSSGSIDGMTIQEIKDESQAQGQMEVST